MSERPVLPQIRNRVALSGLLIALAMQAPARAGSLSGTVSYRERIALPPDAVSEAVLSGGPRQPRASAVPLGRLPASWRGDLLTASGTTRWQVDLFADGSFQLRQSFLDRPGQNSFDDIGRWQLEPGSNRLVLRGGREAPVFFQPLEGGAALQKLDLQGQPIRSRQNARLPRLAQVSPIEPRLHLAGMFRYQADAASIRLCATGSQLPVAMEGDYRALERAYLEALPAGGAGQPMLVNLEGLISRRPSMESGQPPQRTLVVERFGGAHPGQTCPRAKAFASSAPHALASPSLRGTLWRLQPADGGLPAQRRGDQRLDTRQHQDGVPPAGDGL